MALQIVDLPSLTIASGGTTSNAIGYFDDALGLEIYAPSTLTGTCTLEVEPSSTGTSFVTQQSGGSDVTVPAGKGTTLSPVTWRQMRIVSGAAEGGDRTFRVTKSIVVG